MWNIEFGLWNKGESEFRTGKDSTVIPNIISGELSGWKMRKVNVIIRLHYTSCSQVDRDNEWQEASGGAPIPHLIPDILKLDSCSDICGLIIIGAEVFSRNS